MNTAGKADKAAARKRAVVTGGREYSLTDGDRRFLDEIVAKRGITEIVTGGARGVDRQAEAWAGSRGMAVTSMPANWEVHGRLAGILRNLELAKIADVVLAFPGGRGTAHMVREARRRGLPVEESPSRVASGAAAASDAVSDLAKEEPRSSAAEPDSPGFGASV